MNGYLMPLSCPHCGGECAHQAAGKPLLTEVQAVVKCGGCRRQWVVSVHLRPGPEADRTAARREWDRQRRKDKAVELAG